MAKQPNVSKPVAIAVVLGLLAVVVLLVVGLVKLLGGPGYDQYEGRCLPSEVTENDSKYEDMFIDCSDADAHWEVTTVYTREPARADWSSEADARKWLDRTCGADDDATANAAFIFRLDGDKGFLACAVAVD